MCSASIVNSEATEDTGGHVAHQYYRRHWWAGYGGYWWAGYGGYWWAGYGGHSWAGYGGHSWAGYGGYWWDSEDTQRSGPPDPVAALRADPVAASRRPGPRLRSVLAGFAVAERGAGRPSRRNRDGRPSRLHGYTARPFEAAV